MGSRQARRGLLIEVRRLEPADVGAAARVTAAAFEVDISAAAVAAQWRARVEHLLATDPGGSFVAVDGETVVGVGQAMVRESVWCLSLLTVDPAAQSSGAGSALFDATLAYAPGRRGGVIVASNDPRAMTLYARAGFALRPTAEAFGKLRSLPPVDPRVRRLTDPAELRSLESISREIRGAPQTPELRFAMAAHEAQVLVLGDRGFAVVADPTSVWLVTARDEDAARALLIEGLRAVSGSGEVKVGWITEAQEWAVQTAVELGLRLRSYGGLFVQGELGPLWPFIPSPPFS